MRIIDTSVVQALLHPRRTIQDGELTHLWEHVVPTDMSPALPVYSGRWRGASHFGVPRVLDATRTRSDQVWYEPVETDAWRELVAALHAEPAHGGARTVVVPAGLTPTSRDREQVPTGWRLEHPVALEAGQDLEAQVATWVEGTGSEERLRIRDPHGLTTRTHERRDEPVLDSLDQVLRDAGMTGRTTWALEDQDRRVLDRLHRFMGRDAAVVTSLFGWGPRTGYAPVEHLVPADQAASWRDRARVFASVIGITIPERHAYWGSFRNEGVEQVGAASNGPVSPAALRGRVAEEVASWGLATGGLHEQVVSTLVAELATRLRPGEALDGARLYALAATRFDLVAAITER